MPAPYSDQLPPLFHIGHQCKNVAYTKIESKLQVSAASASSFRKIKSGLIASSKGKGLANVISYTPMKRAADEESDGLLSGTDIYQFAKKKSCRNTPVSNRASGTNSKNPTPLRNSVLDKNDATETPPIVKARRNKLLAKNDVETPRTTSGRKKKTSRHIKSDELGETSRDLFGKDAQELSPKSDVEENYSSGAESDEKEEENEDGSDSDFAEDNDYNAGRTALEDGDDFFDGNYKKKSTSNNTMASLPILNRKDIADSLAENRFHEEIEQLLQKTKIHHRKWQTELSLGYNILLYGYGSKKRVCSLFAETLKGYHVINVNGYHPDITITKILSGINDQIFKNTKPFRNLKLQIDFIKNEFSKKGCRDLFLFIHNIDGATIRSHRTQTLLSQLSLIPKIHIVATIDHINALQIWDYSMRMTFKWVWYETTTYAPYKHETEYEDCVLLQKSQTSIRATLTVLRSFNKRTQDIYKILLEYQLGQSEKEKNPGLDLKKFLTKCLENFVVSGADALNSQLNEFTDHEIVTIKKGKDGLDFCFIPLDKAKIKVISEEMCWGE